MSIAAIWLTFAIPESSSPTHKARHVLPCDYLKCALHVWISSRITEVLNLLRLCIRTVSFQRSYLLERRWNHFRQSLAWALKPARGARPGAGLFPYLCGQSSLAKHHSWHLKHMSAITSVVLFSLPPASRENLWASLNVTLSASLVPRWHKNVALSEYKGGRRWMAAIAQRATVICSPLSCSLPRLFQLSEVTFST